MVEFADKRRRFIWPKDGPKGRSGHRGFFGGLGDIMTGRGPDIFIQKGRSRPIRPDFWQNWDSYHSFGAFGQEMAGPFANREFKRYDPYTRKYQTWHVPQDWAGNGAWPFPLALGVHENGDGYPRFTQREWNRMDQMYRRTGQVDPQRMGEEWTTEGPRRHQQEYDWFWRGAHRRGELRALGLPPWGGINENFRPHQEWDDDVDKWIYFRQ